MRIILIMLFLSLVVETTAQTNAKILIYQAKLEYSAGNYKKSIKLLNKAIKKDSKNSDAYFGRAISKENLKDFKGAEKDYQEAIKLDPDNFSAHINLGIVFRKQDKYELAVKEFDIAEKLEPDSRLVYVNRGYAYGSMRKYDLALKDYNRALRIDSSNTKVYFLRSECYDFLGMKDSCLHDLLITTSRDTMNLMARVNLGFTYLSMDMIDKADSIYEGIYKVDKNNPYILSNYGYVTHLKGKTEEGLKMVQESLKNFPKNSFAYKYIALIHISQGKMTEACEAIQKSLEFGYTENYGPEVKDLQKKKCN